MMAEPLASAIALGFVLGLQHATDPDHLVAVGTILSGQRRFGDGAWIGVVWGLGHTLTLALVGGTLLAFNITLRPGVSAAMELVVAAAIITLGLLRLRAVFTGMDGVSGDHLLATHDHGGRAAFHSHPHVHEGALHAHAHVHPSPRLLRALGGAAGMRRAFLIGAVHGLAGTAAVSLLVLATVRTPLGGVAYLAVFGVGTLVGMTALTAALAYPVALAARFRRWHRALGVGAGVGAIAFGVVYAAAAWARS
jgi:high-affinity nickel-transport protein